MRIYATVDGKFKHSSCLQLHLIFKSFNFSQISNTSLYFWGKQTLRVRDSSPDHFSSRRFSTTIWALQTLKRWRPTKTDILFMPTELPVMWPASMPQEVQGRVGLSDPLLYLQGGLERYAPTTREMNLLFRMCLYGTSIWMWLCIRFFISMSLCIFHT